MISQMNPVCVLAVVRYTVSLLELWLPHNTPASHNLVQWINTPGEHISEQNDEERLSIYTAFELLEPFKTEMHG